VTAAEKIIRRRLVFAGYVQGVGFRYWAVRAAASYDIGGYVKNLADGRVEVVVEGPAAAVEDFIAFLRPGPPHGRVTAVEVTEEQPLNTKRQFRVAF